MFWSDKGLAGKRTANVDVDDAGLKVGEDDRGDKLQMDLLTPTGWLGDPNIRGEGITKSLRPPETGLVVETDRCG